MKQVQKKHSAWLQTLLTVVLSVLIASAVWIGRYGVPLLGLPKAEDVQSTSAQAAGGVLQYCGRPVSGRIRQQCKRIKDHAERTTL